MLLYEPLWGMQLFWWAFWIFAMVGVFGFNVPERARVNSLDPHVILKRRFAKGDISEDKYNKITMQFRNDEDLVKRDANDQTIHSKVIGHPIVDGLSLSLTWVVSYTLCSVLFWIAPEVVTTATSKLLHGISTTQATQVGTLFSFADFVSVLSIGAFYAFVVGIVWSFVHSFFLGRRADRRLERLEKRATQKIQLNPQAR